MIYKSSDYFFTFYAYVAHKLLANILLQLISFAHLDV